MTYITTITTLALFIIPIATFMAPIITLMILITTLITPITNFMTYKNFIVDTLYNHLYHQI
jgi:hypothetical protein